MKFNLFELAWAAGFCDGEGCFYNLDRRTEGACLSVGQTEPKILERFRQAVGNMGKVTLERKAKGNYKPMWKYHVGKFEELQQVVCLLWQFLGETKKVQATRVFLAYKKAAINPKGSHAWRRGYCQAGHDIRLSENVIVTKKKVRLCRICSIGRQQEHEARLKGQLLVRRQAILGNHFASSGSKHYHAKLNEADVAKIKQRLTTGESQPSIALSFLVARTTIEMIAIGRTWRHVQCPSM